VRRQLSYRLFDLRRPWVAGRLEEFNNRWPGGLVARLLAPIYSYRPSLLIEPQLSRSAGGREPRGCSRRQESNTCRTPARSDGEAGVLCSGIAHLREEVSQRHPAYS
jgi:hypothetical protein